MTKKDYEVIAKALVDAQATNEVVRKMADALGLAAYKAKGNFDRTKFIEACRRTV